MMMNSSWYRKCEYMNNMYSTVLVKSFAHLNGNFFLDFMEEIGKLWKGWTVYSGVLQLTHFWR